MSPGARNMPTLSRPILRSKKQRWRQASYIYFACLRKQIFQSSFKCSNFIPLNQKFWIFLLRQEARSALQGAFDTSQAGMAVIFLVMVLLPHPFCGGLERMSTPIWIPATNLSNQIIDSKAVIQGIFHPQTFFLRPGYPGKDRRRECSTRRARDCLQPTETQEA